MVHSPAAPPHPGHNPSRHGRQSQLDGVSAPWWCLSLGWVAIPIESGILVATTNCKTIGN
eukprot:5355503-Amphidinium_carterae.1